MHHLLNKGMAKISVILAILLSIKYIIRVVNKKYFNNKNTLLTKTNKVLGYLHKPFGIAIVFTGLIHGMNSKFPVLSFNLGTLCWIFSILLMLNFFVRKTIKTSKPWIYYHRVLTVFFIVTMVAHIIAIKLKIGI